MTFGNCDSSHYLMASSSNHLLVWDLLSCHGKNRYFCLPFMIFLVTWVVPVAVDVLVSDPYSSVSAVFTTVNSSTQCNDFLFNNNIILFYMILSLSLPPPPFPLVIIFSPHSPSPLAIHKDVCPSSVTSAVFVSTEDKSSELYFIDKEQVIDR